MPYVTVNGRKAFYNGPDSPAGERAKGKVVILVHGAKWNHTIWLPQIEFLAAEHTLIAVDLPGHDKSEGPGSNTVAGYTDFLKGLLDALDLTKFVIAGHSMGGSIGVDYALRYSGVQALVPIGAGAQWNIPQAFIDLWHTDPDKAQEALISRSFPEDTDPSVIELYHQGTVNTDLPTMIGDLKALQAFDIVAEMDKIKVPTCIICGDKEAGVDRSTQMHSGISGSTLEWVKDSGHSPTIEKPEITNRLFQNFLNSLA